MQMNRADEVVSQLAESQRKTGKEVEGLIDASQSNLTMLQEGVDHTKELSKKIEILNETITKTSVIMEQMEKFADMIAGFAGVIAGISNKTNMLALNASIEAARAGEHGRGFAVVAKQVGDLAAQSAKSSKEIKETIQSVQASTNEMSTSLNELVSVVEEQNKVNTDTNQLFQKLLESSDNVKEMMETLEHEYKVQTGCVDKLKTLE